MPTINQGMKYEAPNIDEAIEKYSLIMNHRMTFKENDEGNQLNGIDMEAAEVSFLF